jgi:hypothetical protein
VGQAPAAAKTIVTIAISTAARQMARVPVSLSPVIQRTYKEAAV